MTTGPDDVGDRDVFYWPAGTRYPDAELLDVRCVDCAVLWRAHRDLAGSTVACRCGAAIHFAALPLTTEQQFLEHAGSGRGVGNIAARASPLDLDVSTSLALEPGALADADPQLRARWTNRTIIELVLVMAAFVGPGLLIYWNTQGDTRTLLEPIASLIGSLIVLAIGATARSYTFGALRRPDGVHVAEALGVAAVAVIVAAGYVALIESALRGVEFETYTRHRELLGAGMTLFVLAFCPAVFEELAFRGLLHGRLGALVGARQGWLITATTFALAHGITLALPIHLALGLYLGLLRDRSGSLVPGMVLHFVYNGAIVLMD